MDKDLYNGGWMEKTILFFSSKVPLPNKRTQKEKKKKKKRRLADESLNET
jgi:hypothetical protein